LFTGGRTGASAVAYSFAPRLDAHPTSTQPAAAPPPIRATIPVGLPAVIRSGDGVVRCPTFCAMIG
jgi:hypothetical protein